MSPIFVVLMQHISGVDIGGSGFDGWSGSCWYRIGLFIDLRGGVAVLGRDSAPAFALPGLLNTGPRKTKT